MEVGQYWEIRVVKPIKVAAGVLNQTPLAWERNKTNILAAIDTARSQQVQVLCLPELCITGYGCEDAFQSSAVQAMALEVLQEIVPHTTGMITSLGLPLWHEDGLFNVACLVANQQVVGFVGKQNLAGDGLHYEPRWFKPWQEDICATTRVVENEYPLGDLIFDCGGIRIGFEICEDAWVGNRPGHKLAQRGVDIILNPSASHFAFGKNKVRRGFVLEGSRSLHVSYIYANLLGNEAGRAIYDGDAMIASDGEMLVTGPRFSCCETLLSTAVIDVARTRLSREQGAGGKPAVGDDSGSCLVVPFDFQEAAPGAGETVELPAWEKSSGIKEEEFTRAVALGLLDYLRKSRSHGFVVSLSGGADSATVAVLVAMMARLTCQEIGADGLTEKLAYLPGAENLTDTEQWIHRLLACVYQATRNSSETTRTAAESVAEALGAEFFAFDVDQLVEGYVDTVSTAIGRPLNWDDDDLALQNIQARARAPGVWLLANLRNALLLATSNRSEAAVGYTTMDGDTCGGISPIAGIDKAFLRDWLRWMETDGPSGLGPVPELAAVNEQQPTAELRPPAQGQTDESDLMPYTVLDAIERLAIRDKLSPLEIFKEFQADAQMETAGYTHQQLFDWTRRFFQLWSRNQWKRERFAPSFHLDDENLDPKTWCRFPILSGGFERELADLEAFYQVGQLPGDNEG